MPENQTLCVVWSRPDREIPGELTALLQSRRGVRLERSECAYHALARVLKQSQIDDAAAIAGGEGAARTPVVLLMVEPAELDLAGLTHEAAQRFAPHAACWQFESKGNPKMRPVAETDSRNWSAPVSNARGAVTPAGEDARRRNVGFVPGVAVRGMSSKTTVS